MQRIRHYFHRSFLSGGWRRFVLMLLKGLLFVILTLQISLIIPHAEGNYSCANDSEEMTIRCDAPLHAAREREFYTTRHQHDHHEHFGILVWKEGKTCYAGNTNYHDAWKTPYMRGTIPRISPSYRKEGIAYKVYPLSPIVLVPHDRPG